MCLANCDCFFGGLCVCLNSSKDDKNIKTEKESIYGKYSEYKTSSWPTNYLHLGN